MPAETTVTRPAGLVFMLRALKYPNYRLFFGGQLVSLIGSWLSMVATSWLVYRLTNSEDPQHAAIMLGIVGFVGQLPVFLFSPLAGVWVDHFPRHRILIITQTLSMLQSFVLAFLALKHIVTIPQIIALNAFQGMVNAFDVPARQSFVVEIVENRDDLSNAIALSSSMVHAARLLGPAVAGYLIYRFGEGYCFAIDGVSYLAVLAALLAMRLKPHARPATRPPLLRSLREGVAYAIGFPPIRTLLTLVAITSLMAMSQSVLMPIFADRILKQHTDPGGERLLGVLLGSAGFGALCGSLYLASRRTVLGLGRVIAAAGIALGLAVLLFSFSRSLLFSIPLLMVAGGCLVVTMASCNTLLQTIVDDDKRGRVMSLFTMCFLGVAPFGSLLAGGVADLVGAPITLALAGLGCLTASSVFAFLLPSLRPHIRPIYERKGILPQVATGLQNTAGVASATGE